MSEPDLTFLGKAIGRLQEDMRTVRAELLRLDGDQAQIKADIADFKGETQGEFRQVRAHLKLHDTRFDRLDGMLAGLVETVAQTNEKLARTNETVAQNHTMLLAHIDEKIGQTNAAIAKTNQAVVETNQAVAQTNQAVARLTEIVQNAQRPQA